MPGLWKFSIDASYYYYYYYYYLLLLFVSFGVLLGIPNFKVQNQTSLIWAEEECTKNDIVAYRMSQRNGKWDLETTPPGPTPKITLETCPGREHCSPHPATEIVWYTAQPTPATTAPELLSCPASEKDCSKSPLLQGAHSAFTCGSALSDWQSLRAGPSHTARESKKQIPGIVWFYCRRRLCLPARPKYGDSSSVGRRMGLGMVVTIMYISLIPPF